MTKYPAIMRIMSDNATGDLPPSEMQVWTFDGTVDDDWTFTFGSFPEDFQLFQMPEYHCIEIWKTVPGFDTNAYYCKPSPARHARNIAEAREKLEALAQYLIIPPEVMDNPLLFNHWAQFERKKDEESS